MLALPQARVADLGAAVDRAAAAVPTVHRVADRAAGQADQGKAGGVAADGLR